MDENRLSKFLAGEATEAESASVRDWLAESAANRQELARLRRLWEAAVAPPPRPVDVDAAWQRVRGRMKSTLTPAQEETPVVSLPQTRRWVGWRVAASVAVLLGLGWLAYRVAYQPERPPVVLTSAGKPLAISLPDGSKVTLNRSSILTYPANFDEKQRMVSLTGEAFFEVEPNADKPFIIRAAGAEVRVLGTSFNVNATTPNVAVNVATGKVQFSVRQHAVLLTTGQAAAFRAGADTILKVPRADPNANAYKTRLLLFEATPLSQVIEALNHTYQTRIELRHRRIANCPYTVTFENETLDGILSVMAESLGLRVERGADGTIYLDGDGCSSR